MAPVSMLTCVGTFLFLVGHIGCNDKPVVSNKSFFNLNAEEDDDDLRNFEDHSANEVHSRVKRADVSKIAHLYNETRVRNHTQDQIDAILNQHIYYRSATTPEASNMEYMVCWIHYFVFVIKFGSHCAPVDGGGWVRGQTIVSISEVLL